MKINKRKAVSHNHSDNRVVSKKYRPIQNNTEAFNFFDAMFHASNAAPLEPGIENISNTVPLEQGI